MITQPIGKYELLAGALPFTAADPIEQTFSVLNEGLIKTEGRLNFRSRRQLSETFS
jgi:hypothetical protein